MTEQLVIPTAVVKKFWFHPAIRKPATHCLVCNSPLPKDERRKYCVGKDCPEKARVLYQRLRQREREKSPKYKKIRIEATKRYRRRPDVSQRLQLIAYAKAEAKERGLSTREVLISWGAAPGKTSAVRYARGQ